MNQHRSSDSHQRNRTWLAMAAAAAMLFAITATADETRAPASAMSAGGIKAQAGAVTKRGKVIDFDDEVVEGLNKRPLDSLSQISERDRRRKSHLYRKRSGFGSETRETLETLRYMQ